MSLLSTDMHEPFGDDDPSKNNKPYGKVILTLFQNCKPLFQNCNCVLFWSLIQCRRESNVYVKYIDIYDLKRFWDIKPISQRH